MAQMQMLGEFPTSRSSMSYLAEAIGDFGGNYLKAKREQRETQRREGIEQKRSEAEIDIKKRTFERDIAKIDYNKRSVMYKTLTKLLPSLPSEKQVEMTSSPEWLELEKSLGVPSISGSIMTDTKKKNPTWGQDQNIASVRADILRGRVGPKRDIYGLSEPLVLDSREKTIDYITSENLDPSLFEAELARFGGGVRRDVSVRDAGSTPYRFGTEEEAEKANLPSGTVIYINGRKARVK